MKPGNTVTYVQLSYYDKRKGKSKYRSPVEATVVKIKGERVMINIQDRCFKWVKKKFLKVVE